MLRSGDDLTTELRLFIPLERKLFCLHILTECAIVTVKG